ncbi:protein of unknown function [Burkholderia multivorans]
MPELFSYCATRPYQVVPARVGATTTNTK